jgi:iron complex outermembrane receptor protein
MKRLILCSVLITLSLNALAQKIVTGTVKDEQGNPVSNATVLEKGTESGVQTSLDGHFTMKVQSDSAIVTVSHVGLSTEELPVGEAPLDFTLHKSSKQLSEATVVGTRTKRSSTETAVPIDIIPVSRVTNATGQVDLNQVLQFVAPSFNSNRQSGADGADHVDPATLRGLGPDQTLVLINGKRRHQSSLINLYGTRGRGNTGTDLNTIPAASIERIEILRDGAAAQYGSDAIAGVINIVLKKNTGSGTANVSYGTNISGYGSTLESPAGDVLTYKTKNGHLNNDGNMVNANINYGWAVKKEGYFNVTADVLTRDKTYRPNYTPLYPDSYRNMFGDASINNVTGMANFAMPLGQKSTLYSFASLSKRMGDAFAWTRTAESERNVTFIYPNGFDPHIQSFITDVAMTAGITTTFGAWNADFSATYGSNKFRYEVDKSLNASLDSASPTHFDAGAHSLSQLNVGANFNRHFDVAEGLNLATGVEYRHEQYQIFAGEEASWKTYGPVIFSIDGTDTVYRPGGSQGFPGARPENEVNKGRDNVGAFVDAELDITKRWLVTGAIRLENYSDFGFTANYKISTRYKITPNFFVRGSASTGFRAPSLPQIYYNTTFTDVVAGKTIDKVIANNESDLARAAGIPKLKQETSTNVSVGLTTTPFKNFTLTVDGYFVSIKDRIVLTGAFSSDDSVLGPILQPMNVGAVQFFTNALDTKTSGLDIVASYNFALGKGRMGITAAANFNDMTLEQVKTNDLLKGKEDIYFGLREQYFLLASAPKSKTSIIVDYRLRKWIITARATHFSKVELINWRALGDGGPADAAMAAGNQAEYMKWVTDVYDPRTTFDLSVGYSATKHISIIVGGNNIFDAYPSHHDPGWTEGGGMWDAVQMGIGGAYYYGRVLVKF